MIEIRTSKSTPLFAGELFSNQDIEITKIFWMDELIRKMTYAQTTKYSAFQNKENPETC
jgi:hypothetical protein